MATNNKTAEATTPMPEELSKEEKLFQASLDYAAFSCGKVCKGTQRTCAYRRAEERAGTRRL